jgi:hypothetical protein
VGSIPDAHCSNPPREYAAIATMIVADEKGWNSLPWKSFGNLTGEPFGRRIGRVADSYKAPSTEPQDDKREQSLKCQRRNDQKIY